MVANGHAATPRGRRARQCAGLRGGRDRNKSLVLLACQLRPGCAGARTRKPLQPTQCLEKFALLVRCRHRQELVDEWRRVRLRRSRHNTLAEELQHFQLMCVEKFRHVVECTRLLICEPDPDLIAQVVLNGMRRTQPRERSSPPALTARRCIRKRRPKSGRPSRMTRAV